VRLNPFVLAATIVIGVAGLLLAIRAYTTYGDAADAFTRIELVYVPDSFEWQDADYEEGVAVLRLENDSRFPATVESFNISLRFDGQFAGSDYEGWTPVVVPAHDSMEIPVLFQVTANSIQEIGGEAQLSFAGQVLVRFVRFEQPLSFRFRGPIGQVEFDGT
jgi:hypothetical protein